MKKILSFTVFTLLSSILYVNAQTTVFEETFDSSTELPVGWESIALSGFGNQWQVGGNSEIISMGFDGNIVGIGCLPGYDTVLASPSISLEAGNPFALSFLVGAYTSGGNYSANNHYAVYVVPASSTFTGAETPVLEEDTAMGNVAILKTINISAFAGQEVKIYFRQYMSASMGVILFDTVQVIEDPVLSTSETALSEKLKIYPNPTSDYLYIKGLSKMTDVSIFDGVGRKMNAMLHEDKIDVKQLQPGTYFVVIKTENKTYSQKFIKK